MKLHSKKLQIIRGLWPLFLKSLQLICVYFLWKIKLYHYDLGLVSCRVVKKKKIHIYILLNKSIFQNSNPRLSYSQAVEPVVAQPCYRSKKVKTKGQKGPEDVFLSQKRGFDLKGCQWIPKVTHSVNLMTLSQVLHSDHKQPVNHLKNNRQQDMTKSQSKWSKCKYLSFNVVVIRSDRKHSARW